MLERCHLFMLIDIERRPCLIILEFLWYLFEGYHSLSSRATRLTSRHILNVFTMILRFYFSAANDKCLLTRAEFRFLSLIFAAIILYARASGLKMLTLRRYYGCDDFRHLMGIFSELLNRLSISATIAADFTLVCSIRCPRQGQYLILFQVIH